MMERRTLRKLVKSVVGQEVGLLLNSPNTKPLDKEALTNFVLFETREKGMMSSLEVDKLAADAARVFGVPKVNIETIVMDILSKNGMKISSKDLYNSLKYAVSKYKKFLRKNVCASERQELGNKIVRIGKAIESSDMKDEQKKSVRRIIKNLKCM